MVLKIEFNAIGFQLKHVVFVQRLNNRQLKRSEAQCKLSGAEGAKFIDLLGILFEVLDWTHQNNVPLRITTQ